MKKQILAGLLSLAAVGAAFGQPVNIFENDTLLIAPVTSPGGNSDVPQIDALNFINNNVFSIDLFFSSSASLYSTSDTVNYTNVGFLGSATGMRFDTFNLQANSYQTAGTLFNDVGATIAGGGTNYPTLLSSSFTFTPQILATTTNVINRGTFELGPNDFLSFQAQNVDLKGGLINMEGFESGTFVDAGIFDYYWGLNHNDNWVPSGSLGGNAFGNFASSPIYFYTNRNYDFAQGDVALTFATAYQNVLQLGTSNVLIHTVYVQNLADPAISNNVYFLGTEAAVEWTWRYTNVITAKPVQDYMYLFDTTPDVTNTLLHANGTGPAAIAFRDTFIPTNFLAQAGGGPSGFFSYLSANHPPGGFIHTGQPLFTGFPAATPGVAFPYNTGRATNDNASYVAVFCPTTVISPQPINTTALVPGGILAGGTIITTPFEVAHQTYSNMPGRIEINASKFLNLTNSRIAGLNFLKLNAPNHVSSDPKNRILTYAGDYNLAVTNGSLTVTNFLAPTVPRLNGAVAVFSARWTNVNTAFITNVYVVTLVDSEVLHSTPTVVQNLSVHSPDVIITDVLNVYSNLVVDAYNLTIATNAPGTPSTTGQLNLLSGNILWTNSFPNLRTLTNFGLITVDNAAFFGGVRYPPFYPTRIVEPYWDFVNYGTISTFGCFIWATNFQDTGIINGNAGSITVQATSAALTNAFINAGLPGTSFNGDISLYSSSLFISNTVLNATRKLTLWATNSLNDGGTSTSNFSGNFWTVGVGGFNLLAQPAASGSLLGTTISNTAPDNANVICQWAGRDLGPVPAGFNNNAALGRLILAAGTNSGSFELEGVSSPNALYVDYLELRDGATNFDTGGNLANLTIDSGIKIYYAQLFIVTNDATGGGYSRAEKLDHKNGGALNWVRDYAGFYSSTNITYTNGITYAFNKALRDSCNIDSNNDGIPNCSQLFPFLVPAQIVMTVTLTNRPPLATRLTWPTIAYSANSVYYKGMTGTNWTLLTNFMFGPNNGTATVLDNMTASNRLYRVRVDVVH